MNNRRITTIADKSHYRLETTGWALTDPGMTAVLGRAAQVSMSTGGCSVTTYATADECRRVARMFAELACDIDRCQLADEAQYQLIDKQMAPANLGDAI